MTTPIEPLNAATASDIAARVRTGMLDPSAVLEASLRRIAALDPQIGAFEVRRDARARGEAEILARREDLHTLPLAGVPVAVKDLVPVEGEPRLLGTRARRDAVSTADHEVVRRLRSAGAIIVGLTRVPELCIWGTSDNAFGTVRNPWDLRRTAGGSSGGSAAAVAAGMVPIALGADGMGSIRIPAAACGIVGMKPGRGVVPAQLGASSWLGLAENGPLATTVADAALMLSVIADRPDLAAPPELPGALRIAVSTRAPVAGLRVAPELARATREAAARLRAAGHRVVDADPPRLNPAHVFGTFACWTMGPAEDAEELDRASLERRTRVHVGLGRLARTLGITGERTRRHWQRLAARFFDRYDALLTPPLAALPIAAERWSERGWMANVHANLLFAPFTAPWNLAAYPAASVPTGTTAQNMPMSVQIVAAAGREATVLAVARQLESSGPWTRHAPPP